MMKELKVETSKKWLYAIGAAGSAYLMREAWTRVCSKNLNNQIVVITGGNSGIGKLMAIKMAKEGAIIVIWARDKKTMDETAQEIRSFGGRVHTYVCDVSDKKNIDECAERVKREVGDVTILINNAGIVNGKQFLQTDDEAMLQTMKVNVISNFWTVKAFLPTMLKNKNGHIVTIASAGAVIGTNGLSDYSASKFAQFGFHEAIRAELRQMIPSFDLLRGKGVQTTCICPYFISTGMFDGVKDNNFSYLLPILTPEYVAERAVSAIKRCEPLVIIPSFVWATYLVRTLFPTRVFDFIMFDVLGVGKTMSEFKGRNKKDYGGSLASKM
eukprot:GEZU01019224.1.p1 GENE.GEZU01019224.1~~GEZU01019224.1.p1  ORF type:complete len:327 (-),score=71.43 GEZU01019224.1:102-1082(-)